MDIKILNISDTLKKIDEKTCNEYKKKKSKSFFEEKKKKKMMATQKKAGINNSSIKLK